MNQEWDYAKLSVLAKENGGPEELVKKITKASYQKGYRIGYTNGYNKGATDALCVVFIIATSMFLYFSYKRYLKKLIKSFEKISEEEMDEAKQKIIKGINDYNENSDK